MDVVESLAIERAKKLFSAEHVNVQPHSGSQANMAVYFTVLQPRDRLLTMDLAHGGHLTHGHKANFSGKLYEIHHYGVDHETEQIDYDALARLANEVKPKMITAGASAYSRTIDFRSHARDRGFSGCLPFRRHGAYCGTSRRGRPSESNPARTLCYYNHAQELARSARGIDHVQGGIRQAT